MAQHHNVLPVFRLRVAGNFYVEMVHFLQRPQLNLIRMADDGVNVHSRLGLSSPQALAFLLFLFDEGWNDPHWEVPNITLQITDYLFLEQETTHNPLRINYYLRNTGHPHHQLFLISPFEWPTLRHVILRFTYFFLAPSCMDLLRLLGIQTRFLPQVHRFRE